MDPLAPDTGINPDNQLKSIIPPRKIKESFLIDFASQFYIWRTRKKNLEEATYYASSQLGRDTNEELIKSDPKPNYVQITDNRPEADSWELPFGKSEQFKNWSRTNWLGRVYKSRRTDRLWLDHDGAQLRETSSDEIINFGTRREKTACCHLLMEKAKGYGSIALAIRNKF